MSEGDRFSPSRTTGPDTVTPQHLDMRLTAVVPTFNRQAKLDDTLYCLQRQTLPANDYEIIVVDDGSTPPAVLPEPTGGASVSLIRFDEILERAIARNAAAEAARGEVLFFSDDDMGIGPDFLEAHLRAQVE